MQRTTAAAVLATNPLSEVQLRILFFLASVPSASRHAIGRAVPAHRNNVKNALTDLTNRSIIIEHPATSGMQFVLNVGRCTQWEGLDREEYLKLLD